MVRRGTGIFSPSVGFADSSLVRGSQGGRYCALSFFYWQSLHIGDPSGANAPAPLEGAPRGAEHRHCTNPKSLPRSAAPFRGSPQCAHWGKGSPELRLEQMGKERADLNTAVIAKPVRKLAVAIRIPFCAARKYTAVIKRNGFPRRFAPRNDRGSLDTALSFP